MIFIFIPCSISVMPMHNNSLVIVVEHSLSVIKLPCLVNLGSLVSLFRHAMIYRLVNDHFTILCNHTHGKKPIMIVFFGVSVLDHVLFIDQCKQTMRSIYCQIFTDSWCPVFKSMRAQQVLTPTKSGNLSTLVRPHVWKSIFAVRKQ